MSTADEVQFLTFLRELAPIRLMESFAPTTDALWVEEFSPQFVGHIGYTIWNTRFLWTPEYGTVTRAANPKDNGQRYVSNASNAPLIEYSRADPEGPASRPGRIFWGKHFSAPFGLSYDVRAFTKWYEAIISWVRKNRKRIARRPGEPYYLPCALAAIKAAGSGT